jgi:hypothetical protein
MLITEVSNDGDDTVDLKVEGLGFKVWGFGSRVQGSGFRA